VENHQRKTTALYHLTLRYQTSVVVVHFPLLYSRLQAIEQAACADFALLSCLVSAAAAKNQSEFYIFGVASAAEQ